MFTLGCSKKKPRCTKKNLRCQYMLQVSVYVGGVTKSGTCQDKCEISKVQQTSSGQARGERLLVFRGLGLSLYKNCPIWVSMTFRGQATTLVFMSKSDFVTYTDPNWPIPENLPSL